MNFSRLLGCCGYPVNRVKHIEGTHLRDFNSDKKVWIHTPQEKQATGHCLEVALNLHAGVYTVIYIAKLRRILQDVLLMSEI